MDDTVHVEVEVVHLFAIWIRSADVDWNLNSIDLLRLLLDDTRDDFGVFLREPSEKSWNTHVEEMVARWLFGEGLR